MDMLDIVALCGLERVYDKTEDRFGRLAAWLVTTALAVSILAAIVAILIGYL
jgi:TRAP-type mannitol/chloroaromatic compound transport system permease small subunit